MSAREPSTQQFIRRGIVALGQEKPETEKLRRD